MKLPDYLSKLNIILSQALSMAFETGRLIFQMNSSVLNLSFWREIRKEIARCDLPKIFKILYHWVSKIETLSLLIVLMFWLNYEEPGSHVQISK